MSQSLSSRLDEIQRKNKLQSSFKARLDEQEFKELSDKNYNAILQQNPASILNEYYTNIRYINGKYKFSRRLDDVNASTFCYLSGGNWYYKDYGDATERGTGTIVSLVQENNRNLSYNEVIKLCLNKLGLTDCVKEALDVISLQNYYMDAQLKIEEFHKTKTKSIEEILKTADDNAKIAKETNSKLERESKVLSRITYASKQIPPKFIDLLIKRGITQPSQNFYYIKGENFKEDEHGILYKSSTTEGVGVITANNENLSELTDIINQVEKKGYYAFNENLKTGVKFGGDVHIIPYTDSFGNNHKTRSFGVGGITLTKNNPLNKKIALFESKMDYHALDNYFKFNDNGYDICIANSTNNLKKVVSFLKDSEYQEVFCLNQFDLPALHFNINVMIDSNIEKFKFLEYKEDEYKKDGNDLVYDEVNIFDRVKSGTVLDFKEQMQIVKKHLKSENDLRIMGTLEEKLESFKESITDKNLTSNEAVKESPMVVLRLNKNR